MIWANRDNIRIRAVPNTGNAKCILCEDIMIPKCGSIKAWHWAHKSKKECDDWYEPESKWHMDWKNKFPKEWQEVKMGKHIADIKTPKNVIELQNSSILLKDIIEREVFYDNMVWVLNGEKFAKNLELRKGKVRYGFKENDYTFRWKWAHQCWWYANKPIYIHMNGKWIGLGDDINFMFLLKKIHKNIPCGGWGKVVNMEDFLDHSLKEAGEVNNMKIDEAFPTRFLSASDITKDVSLEIKEVIMEEVGRDKDKKPVVYFHGIEKGLVLNKTNANKIKDVLESDDTDDWKNKKITLVTREVEYQGESVAAIRVSEGG